MRALIEEIIRERFPQLAGGAQTTHKAQVIGVSDAPKGGEIADQNRPRFAVDLQLLNADGSVNDKLPILTGVPLPVAGAGEEGGTFSFPSRGAVVDLAFEGGNPSQPKIAQIYGEEGLLPAVDEGEKVFATRAGVEMRIDANGNHWRTTDAAIRDSAQTIAVDADDAGFFFGERTEEVDADSALTIGGSWIAKVAGALKWQVVEDVILKCTAAIKLTSAKEFLVQSNKKAQIRAPAVYVGSDAVDLVAKVEELSGQVAALAEMVAAHTHPLAGPPTTAAQATAVAVQVTAIELQVKTIVS